MLDTSHRGSVNENIAFKVSRWLLGLFKYLSRLFVDVAVIFQRLKPCVHISYRLLMIKCHDESLALSFSQKYHRKTLIKIINFISKCRFTLLFSLYDQSTLIVE